MRGCFVFLPGFFKGNNVRSHFFIERSDGGEKLLETGYRIVVHGDVVLSAVPVGVSQFAVDFGLESTERIKFTESVLQPGKLFQVRIG